MSGPLRDLVRASPALSGCALVLLLLAGAALLLPCYSDDVLAGVVRSWQDEVEARLPADLPEGERTALAWAFQDAIHAVRTGDPDPAALERVRRTVRSGGDRWDVERVRLLTADLRVLAGQEAGTAGD